MAKALYGTVNATERKIKSLYGVINNKYAKIKKVFGVVNGIYAEAGNNQAAIVFANYSNTYMSSSSATAQPFSEVYTSLDNGATWDVTLFRVGWRIMELEWVKDRFFLTISRAPVSSSNTAVDFYSSPDGVSWTQCYSYTTPKYARTSKIFYVNGQFVALVGYNNAYSEDVLTSDDGRTWTRVASPSFVQTTRNEMSIVYGDGRYYLVKSGDEKIYYSSNLSSWTRAANTEAYPCQVYGCVYFGGKLYVAFNSKTDGTHSPAVFGVYVGTGSLASWTKKIIVSGDYNTTYSNFGGASIDISPDGSKMYYSSVLGAPTYSKKGLFYSTDGNAWTLIDSSYYYPVIWHKGQMLYAQIFTNWNRDEIATSYYRYNANIFIGPQKVNTIMPQSGHVMEGGTANNIMAYKENYWLTSSQKGE